MVEMLPELIAVGVALLALVAEAIHLRRIKRIKFLAFGPSGQPVVWTWLAPVVRVVGLSLACWGFLSLWLVVEAKIHKTGEIDDKDYKHLVLVIDVSPSMRLPDAGLEGKQSRRMRASQIVESLFNRIPTSQFKITVIAVYSSAKPLVEDSLDREVVRHIMEEMPLYHAFKPGRTNLLSGIKLAGEIAKPWRKNSAFVVMLTDGDSVPAAGMPKMPVSVKEFVVVGVGNPNTGTFIHDHQSRQDVASLRQIANRLRGAFHNGNKKHLTSQIVSQFTESTGEKAIQEWGRREWALFSVAFGSGMLAVLPMLLHYFGAFYVAGTALGGR